MKNRSIILFLLLCNALVAQQFNFSNIGTDRGLPSSEVYYVLQDHKGYMWFATTYGVCRYNGKRFTTYTTAQGLTDNTVLTMCEDKQGRIWFGPQNNEVCYWQNDTIYTPPAGKSLSKVLDNGGVYFLGMYVDSAKNIWMSTNTRLYLSTLTDLKSTIEPTPNDDSVNIVLKIIDGKKILVASQIHPKKSLLPDRRIIGYDSPEGRKYVEIKIPSPPTSPIIYRTALLTDGRILFAYANFLYAITPDGKLEIKTYDRSIITLNTDKDNGLWIGFFKGGLAYYKNQDIHSKPIRCLEKYSVGVGSFHWNNLVPTGKVMVKESANVDVTTPTFTNLSLNFSLAKNVSHAKICVGPVVSGVAQFFLNTLGTNSSDFWGIDGMFIHTFKKNVNTGALSAYANLTPDGVTSGREDRDMRLTIAYDDVNKAVWFGGVEMNYLYVPTPTPSPLPVAQTGILAAKHTSGGYIHDDIHDIKIQTYNNQLEMYVAHDAGIARTILGTFGAGNPPPDSPDVSKLHFYPLNNELDVSLVKGFSGSEQEPNLYILGGHDIVNTDIYDANTGKNRYTKATWENDGAWIDKFDKNRMFLDANEYGADYYTSSDGGATMSSYSVFYDPAPGNVFAKGVQNTRYHLNGFDRRSRNFHQDPYRPGRIFQGKTKMGISQFDPVSKTFVCKIEPWKVQPNLGGNASCRTGAWKIDSLAAIVKGMSFSPQTPNSFHFIVNGNPDINCPGRPSVIKYIGNNLDDCWNGHNLTTYTDASGTHPQWQNITPIWKDFGIMGMDSLGIDFIEIATSPWDKNVVYVMMNVPHHPEISVLKYDGNTWSDYSTGLSNQEWGTAMIMDYQSNDGMYLSTHLRIYYRDASMDQWEVYKTGIPYVPATQIEVNYAENTVRAGTYGRGIWKTDLKCPTANTLPLNNMSVAPGFHEGYYITSSNSIITTNPPTIFRAVNSITLNPNFIADASFGGYFLGYIHGCTDSGNSFVKKSNDLMYLIQGEDDEEKEEQERIEENSIQASPNPSNGLLTLTFLDDAIKNVIIHDMMGKVVFKDENVKGNTLKVDITNQPAGIYLIKVISGEDVISKKIIVQ